MMVRSESNKNNREQKKRNEEQILVKSFSIDSNDKIGVS